MIPYNPDYDVDMVIVGEFPGPDEVGKTFNSVGSPFLGYESKYLSRLMKAAGLDWKDVAIINVVNRIPPGKEFNRLPQDEKDNCVDFVRTFLEEKRPNVVLTIGKASMQVLTGRTNVEKNRGVVMPSVLVDGLKVISTYHPGFVIRGNGKMEPILIYDIQKALKESETPDIWDRDRDVEIISDNHDAITFFNYYANYHEPVACDIETDGGAIMTAYGVAVSKSKAYTVTRECFRDAEVMQALSVFCDGPVPKIFHNGLFDVIHGAYYWNLHTRNFFYDTMLAQHAVMPIMPKSLGFCASIYTNLPSWKNEGHDVFKDIAAGRFHDWDDFYMYNAKDCCATYEIYEQLEKQIDFYKVRPTFNLMMRMVQPFLRGMLGGIKIDPKRIEAFKDENESIIAVLEHIKNETLGDINLRSSKQKYELIYNEWKMPKQKHQGKVSTNKMCIEKLERYPTPYKMHLGLINTLTNYWKKRDFYKLKYDADGRLRSSLKVHGSYTGRVSASKFINGTGLNLMNQPKAVRSFYVPDDGKIFVQMDLSQAEARVVAALCKDEFWMRQFDEMDLHSWVASQLFDIPIEKVRKSVERQTAKRVAHACVSPDTEVLTPAGWQRVDAYIPGTPIYRVDPSKDGEGCFVIPDEFEAFPFNGELFHIEGDELDQLITPGHTLPVCMPDGAVEKTPIEKVLENENAHIFNRVRSKGNGVVYNKDWLHLMIAYTIAGHKNEYMLYWILNDEDVVNKLVDIFKKFNIDYGAYVYNDDLTWVAVALQDVPAWVYKTKIDVAWLLSRTCEVQQVILDAIAEWCAGVVADDYNDSKRCFDLLQHVLLLKKLAGYSADYTRIKSVGKVPYEGPVYNFAVDSGYYLIRRNGKISVTGNSHYLLGWGLLSKILKCSAKEAKAHKAKYYEARPMLADWQDRVKETVNKKHAIRTPYGRLIQFPGPKNDDVYRAATAAEPQSTSSDYLQSALCKMYESGPEEFEFHVTVHDSILFSVPANVDALVRNIQALKEFTEVTIDVHGVPLMIPCDFEIGYDWYHMHEIKETDKKTIEQVFDKATAAKESDA